MNNSIIIVRVKEVLPHPNADRLAIVKLFGTQVITDKSVRPGDLMAYADSNLKLSKEFLSSNNLYRHSELNKNPDKKGFFEDNGRVKAIKLRGEVSDGFLFSLRLFDYISTDIVFEEGQEFTELEGHKICEKYIPYVPKEQKPQLKTLKKQVVPAFIEYFDTDQFMRNKHKIPPNTKCYIEEKVHGTSHRTIYTSRIDYSGKINPIKQFLANLFLPKSARLMSSFTVSQICYINGTRHVILLTEEKQKNANSGSTREEILEHIKAKGLHRNEEVYLEIFGYEKTGSPIQKGFTYGCVPGRYRVMLYRVTLNSYDGYHVDLSREAVYKRAEELGFEPPKLLGIHYYDGSEESMQQLEEKVIRLAQGQSKMGNGAEDTLQEGVVVWFIDKDGKWTALKYKSDAFRLKESSNKDKGIIDSEDLL